MSGRFVLPLIFLVGIASNTLYSADSPVSTLTAPTTVAADTLIEVSAGSAGLPQSFDWYIESSDRDEFPWRKTDDPRKIVFTGPSDRYKIVLHYAEADGTIHHASTWVVVQPHAAVPTPGPSPSPPPTPSPQSETAPIPADEPLSLVIVTNGNDTWRQRLKYAPVLRDAALFKAQKTLNFTIFEYDSMTVDADSMAGSEYQKIGRGYIQAAKVLPYFFIVAKSGRILRSGPIPASSESILAEIRSIRNALAEINALHAEFLAIKADRGAK